MLLRLDLRGWSVPFRLELVCGRRFVCRDGYGWDGNLRVGGYESIHFASNSLLGSEIIGTSNDNLRMSWVGP